MSDNQSIADVSRFAAGTWLKGNALSRPSILTIEAVETVTFDDGTERLILRFVEITEAMRLNGTQTRELVALYGTDGRLWVGQHIMVSRGPSYQGNATILIADASPVPTVHNGTPRAGSPQGAQSTPPMTPATAAQPVAVSTKDIPF